MSKVNNKLSRKRAEQRPALTDGTQVLKTAESRVKIRRWTFEAEVRTVLREPEVEAAIMTLGPLPRVLGPVHRLRLESVVFGTAQEARTEIPHQVSLMRGANQMMEKANIRVIAVPHETVSQEVVSQLNRSQNMNILLDKAYEIAVNLIRDGYDGKLTEELREATLMKAKEMLYQKAIDWYKAQEETKPDEVPIIEVPKEETEKEEVKEPVTGNMSAVVHRLQPEASA